MENKTVNYWIDRVRNELMTETDRVRYDRFPANGDVFGESSYTKNDDYHLNVEEIEQVGGEGEGEDYHVVFKITDKVSNEEVYIKFDGSYDSYNGTEWYSKPYLVTPQEETIIVYK